jgi:alkylhydroperoxidase family enzyme
LKEPGGWKTSVFTPDQQAAIHFAEQLTGYPDGVDEHDLDALGKHFDQEQIVELVATIATANLTNRINEGLKTPVDV